MNFLAFDGRMGASGDMLLSALLAAGADRAMLAPIEDALGVEYAIDTTVENGIAATTVDVRFAADREADDDDGNDRDYDTGDDHSHDQHDHGYDRAHDHSDEDAGRTAEGHGPHRSYAEVVEIVERMDLSPTVERRSIGAFERLGQAEAAIHDEPLESIRFHEVGADDAIADVTGAMALLSTLEIDRVVTTPVSAGGGEVSMSHGTYPVPAPAVVEIAADADWSLQGGPIEVELLTPTGAAILAEIAEGVERLPPIEIETVGYGAGSKTFRERPNVLRAIVGRGEGRLRTESIAVLETNLDDATPEVLGGLQESLLEAGARDVSIVPVTMKKSRPGHLVKVIVRPEDAERVAHRLAIETGTLGVRVSGSDHRFVADRSFETAHLSYEGSSYEVPVKVAETKDGERFDLSAEYDAAAAVAEAVDVPVREVIREAEAAIADRLEPE